MITVEFIEVGRDKKSWTETLPDLDYRSLLRSVKKRGAILSNSPDFEIDEDGLGGAVVAGFRTVGRFKFTFMEASQN